MAVVAVSVAVSDCPAAAWGEHAVAIYQAFDTRIRVQSCPSMAAERASPCKQQGSTLCGAKGSTLKYVQATCTLRYASQHISKLVLFHNRFPGSFLLCIACLIQNSFKRAECSNNGLGRGGVVTHITKQGTNACNCT